MQVDAVIGDGKPTLEQLRELRYTTRVINESMRLYPQPPVLIRRALEDDVIGGYHIPAGSDFFISVWNLHRSPALWEDPDAFRPMRFGPLDGKIPNEVRAALCGCSCAAHVVLVGRGCAVRCASCCVRGSPACSVCLDAVRIFELTRAHGASRDARDADGHAGFLRRNCKIVSISR